MRELKIVIKTKQSKKKKKGQILLPSGRNRKKKRPAETKPQLILLKTARLPLCLFSLPFVISLV